MYALGKPWANFRSSVPIDSLGRTIPEEAILVPADLPLTLENGHHTVNMANFFGKGGAMLGYLRRSVMG